MHLAPMHNDTDESDNAVQETMMIMTPMRMIICCGKITCKLQRKCLEDNQVVDGCANNKYVEPEDLHPSEFEDYGRVNSTYMENIISDFNRSTTPTAIEDLRMRDILVKFLQAIIEWSI